MIIPDLQIPGEHPKALSFCKQVQKDCKIPKDGIIIIGDELDLYHASSYPKDPDMDFTPRGEIKLARERLKEWVSAFPMAMVCTSNHGMRWLGRVYDSFIPTEVIKSYRDIFNIPKSWEYRDEWIIGTKKPFRAIHGTGYSGILGHRNAAIDGRISTVIGHLHSHAGVNFIRNQKEMIWGMNCGSLIDHDSFIFRYSKYSRFKAVLSLGVVLNDGSTPLVVPFEGTR